MVLTSNQKKELVIKLYEEGKTTREIAKELRMSLRDIGIILKEHNKEPEPKPSKSPRAEAFQMFSDGKTTIEVLTFLDLSYDHVIQYHNEYLSLKTRTNFIDLYEKYERYMPFLIDMIEKIRRGELSEWDLKIIFQYYMDSRKLLQKIKLLENDIYDLEIRKSCLERGILNGRIPGLD